MQFSCSTCDEKQSGSRTSITLRAWFRLFTSRHHLPRSLQRRRAHRQGDLMKAPRFPFFYGWAIVAVAFVTMGVAVNARTAFSLLFPPILDEFGWERGVTAGAFSFGFFISAVLSPLLGRLMDRHGPLIVLEVGVGIMGIGLLFAAQVSQPWHLYLTLGVLVGSGSVALG